VTRPARSSLRTDLVAIFRAALAAVDPAQRVAAHLVRDGERIWVQSGLTVVTTWQPPTLVVGAGKAAARMAAACEQILGAAAVSGEVIVADGCARNTESIRVTEAGHPLPDRRGEDATQRIVEMLRIGRAGGTLCLISGGASSLLVQPQPPVRLQDKITTTRLLLECGAEIGEMNCVRKHLSAVMGGGLGRLVRGRLSSLLLSDVVGDDPATIGSGPTVPDPTTFTDAWQVLERYNLIERVPGAVAQLLRDGVKGQIAETLKPGSPEAERCRNLIVGSNRTALQGAAEAARSLGWTVHIEANPLRGDTTPAARKFGAALGQLTHQTAGTRLCVLAGGETTVTVTGPGRGGRNQEFALALIREVAGLPIVLLSAGTDGIDGPTEAAGAFVDGTSLQRARTLGLDPEAALVANDSYSFFAALGDLFQCGPTGTNVMDTKVALINA
jgi:hydroxypyruvate reductase